MLESLVEGWIGHFWAADHTITWLEVEVPLYKWLTPNTLLVGVSDARGRTEDGNDFFGEWKTANPRERETWKQVWRMNPQSLTYGVLWRARQPNLELFTVRKAFKPTSATGKNSHPSYDFEWFRYSQAELDHWEQEVVRIADEIRAYRLRSRPFSPIASNFRGMMVSDVRKQEAHEQVMSGSWPTNYLDCFKYGIKYPCPFMEGCHAGNWSAQPGGVLIVDPRLKTLPPDARAWGLQVINTGPSKVKKSDAMEEKGHPRGNLSRVGTSNVEGADTEGGLSIRPSNPSPPSDLVVLSATSIETWLRCRERYRKHYEEGMETPSNEAAELGGDFHRVLARHYRSLIHKEEPWNSH